MCLGFSPVICTIELPSVTLDKAVMDGDTGSRRAAVMPPAVVYSVYSVYQDMSRRCLQCSNMSITCLRSQSALGNFTNILSFYSYLHIYLDKPFALKRF